MKTVINNTQGVVTYRDGNKIISAPFDETFLIMPTKRFIKGKTAVRLATNFKGY